MEDSAENKNGSNPDESSNVPENGVDDLKNELEQARKDLLYQRADFDNYKKRIIKEQEQAIKFANEKLVRELSGIVDLLGLGLTHGKNSLEKKTNPEKELKALVDGVGMTYSELVQLLGRFGVEFVGTVGEKFDPNKHEAISQIESSDAEDNTVAQVLQKGTLLHGRLLIPAKVVVAHNKKEE